MTLHEERGEMQRVLDEPDDGCCDSTEEHQRAQLDEIRAILARHPEPVVTPSKDDVARTLGGVIDGIYESLLPIVRKAGLGHMLTDDGDGDWQAIWELLEERVCPNPVQLQVQAPVGEGLENGAVWVSGEVVTPETAHCTKHATRDAECVYCVSAGTDLARALGVTLNPHSQETLTVDGVSDGERREQRVATLAGVSVDELREVGGMPVSDGEREALAHVFPHMHDVEDADSYDYQMADAVLAAGYRKPTLPSVKDLKRVIAESLHAGLCGCDDDGKECDYDPWAHAGDAATAVLDLLKRGA